MRASSKASKPRSYGDNFSLSGLLGAMAHPKLISKPPNTRATRINNKTGTYSASIVQPNPLQLAFRQTPRGLATIFTRTSLSSLSAASFCALYTGADGETRTHTAFATAPSRRRVYQFHHDGLSNQ